MRKVISIIAACMALVSCQKSIGDNGTDYHGTSFRLSRPEYNKSHDYKQGEIGRSPICNGAFDWGRNFGNTWSFNEFDNGNIKHYEKLYTDSIGYIEFLEGGIGNLVMTNQDSIAIEVGFTYEFTAKDRGIDYLKIYWDDVEVRTYVQKDKGRPLSSFQYENLGDGLFVWKGNMSEFNGVYDWCGNSIAYFNNDFSNCYK